MRTIFAEYNPQCNSIDVYTNTGYILRIDCWEAEKNLRTTPGSDCALTSLATVYKGNIIKNLIMDCQSYTKYRPNETTGGIFVSWRRKEELPTGA